MKCELLGLNLIILLSLVSYSSFAQNDSNKIKNITAPSGAYLNTTLGRGLNASLNIISGGYSYSIRGSLFYQDKGFIIPRFSMDGGILFGKVINRDEDYHFIIMAGIAATETNERGAKSTCNWCFGDGYLRIKQRVVGIPIELQYSYHGEIVGIGATLFANINTEQPMLGFGISFQFGKLY